jgi:hypothetical protein
LAISIFGTAALAPDLHAAKVCVQDWVMGAINQARKGYFCSNSNSSRGGGGSQCWCFRDGSWWFSYGSTEANCPRSCPANCGVGS